MSLRDRVIRLASLQPEGSPLRKHLVSTLRREAGRGWQEATPMTNLSEYLDDFKASLKRPYPSISDALGVQPGEVSVVSRAANTHGVVEVKTPTGTDITITVDGKTGEHRIEGQAEGQKFQPKTLKWRPPVGGVTRGTMGDVVDYIEDNYTKQEYKFLVVTSNGHKLYNSVEELRRDYQVTGTQSGGHLRRDLVGQPVLRGLIGPMWGGLERGVATIRYEDQSTYNRNSA